MCAAGGVQNCLNVCDPYELLTLEVLEDPPQCRRAVGGANHKGMDPDRDDGSLAIGMSLGFSGQFGHIVDPQPLYIARILQALKILSHIDCDGRKWNQDLR